MSDLTPEEFDELLETLAEYSSDPLGFVMWNYPWGEPGSELENFTGPELWQIEILTDLGNGIISIREAIAAARGMEAATDPVQIARTSGHGIGKSALVSWILDWAQSTLEDTKGVVTANTENQLKTKTWAEFAKWHRMGLSRHLFRMTATARFSVDPEHATTWRIDMVPWSEKNTEAFAGLHNQGKRIIVIFDEASTIPDLIWETTEGALTDKNTEIIWAVFGNPTVNQGRFRDCFSDGKFAHRWNAQAIDSRTVSITNKSQLQKWIDDYGLDHDFVRVRVTGKFPRTDAVSFISRDVAYEATKRRIPDGIVEPWVIGVDVARFGNDKSVIYPRRGRDARSETPQVFQGISTVQLASHVFNTWMRLGAAAVFVDGGGVGGGVVDQLRSMGVPVFEVTFGGKSDYIDVQNIGVKYRNKRTEIWGSMRSWLVTGCIPSEIPMLEQSLADELSITGYKILGEDVIGLETKDELKRRGEKSPDASDALACTFAYPSVIPSEVYERNPRLQQKNNAYTDINPYDRYEKEYY